MKRITLVGTLFTISVFFWVFQLTAMADEGTLYKVKLQNGQIFNATKVGENNDKIELMLNNSKIILPKSSIVSMDKVIEPVEPQTTNEHGTENSDKPEQQTEATKTPRKPMPPKNKYVKYNKRIETIVIPKRPSDEKYRELTKIEKMKRSEKGKVISISEKSVSINNGKGGTLEYSIPEGFNWSTSKNASIEDLVGKQVSFRSNNYNSDDQSMAGPSLVVIKDSKRDPSFEMSSGRYVGYGNVKYVEGFYYLEVPTEKDKNTLIRLDGASCKFVTRKHGKDAVDSIKPGDYLSFRAGNKHTILQGEYLPKESIGEIFVAVGFLKSFSGDSFVIETKDGDVTYTIGNLKPRLEFTHPKRTINELPEIYKEAAYLVVRGKKDPNSGQINCFYIVVVPEN